MNFGMQGFDATLHHFWKLGVVAHLCDRDGCFLKRFSGATSRQNAVAMLLDQCLGKWNQVSFITDRDEGGFLLHKILNLSGA